MGAGGPPGPQWLWVGAALGHKPSSWGVQWRAPALPPAPEDLDPIGQQWGPIGALPRPGCGGGHWHTTATKARALAR